MFWCLNPISIVPNFLEVKTGTYTANGNFDDHAPLLNHSPLINSNDFNGYYYQLINYIVWLFIIIILLNYIYYILCIYCADGFTVFIYCTCILCHHIIIIIVTTNSLFCHYCFILALFPYPSIISIFTLTYSAVHAKMETRNGELARVQRERRKDN